MSWRPCLFCTLPTEVYSQSASTIHCRCLRCGSYNITTEAELAIEQAQFTNEQVANISGYIRDNQSLTIKERDLEFLRNLRTPTVAEKAMKALIQFAKENSVPGTTIASAFDGLEHAVLESKAMLADDRFTEERIDKECLAAIRMAGVCSIRTSDELYYVADEYLKVRGLATGDRASTCIDPRVQKVNGKSVCLVACQRSPEPVFLKWKDIQPDTLDGDFYVRSGPGSVKLSPGSTQEFIKTRFPQRK